MHIHLLTGTGKECKLYEEQLEARGSTLKEIDYVAVQLYQAHPDGAVWIWSGDRYDKLEAVADSLEELEARRKELEELEARRQAGVHS